MRRIGALLLDVFIIAVLAVIVGVSAVLVFRTLPSYFTDLLMQGTIFLYTFLCDYLFNGITIGKKAAKLEIKFVSQIPKFKFAILHALFKTITIDFGIISLIVFLCRNGTMPYENWLGIKVVEKNTECSGGNG